MCDPGIEQQAVVGQKFFLLNDEKAELHTFEKHTLMTVERIDGGSFVASGQVSHQWRRQSESAEVSFPLAAEADGTRFLWLKDQEIDGLAFSPVTPTEPGDYWFYGVTSEARNQLKLGVGHVRPAGDNRLVFWFFGDVEFSGNRLSMQGLWAKAWAPKMPGRDSASIDR